MSLGPPPCAGAHSVCMRPPRDRTCEQQRTVLPPVPRAPRAKPRTNSCGALARAMYTRTDSTSSARSFTPTRSSEFRRPRDNSPMSGAVTHGHARVNLLNRELESIENQGFVMGPRRSVDIKLDHRRGHNLGKEVTGQGGMPWTVDDDQLELSRSKEPGRRRTLHHERKAADQALEWVPCASKAAAASVREYGRDHSRKNVLVREDVEAARSLDCPSIRPPGCTSTDAEGPGYYGRRSVLKREQVVQESFPTPRGGGEGFGKRDLLIRENGLPNQGTAVAAH
eukprot:TRINITY_DN70248_c0_g1_i1.p1 TRINITY_DN70248_c0_g1~~TRINITY_DN70248_c0_g1_i1.p1  ORF type:complete len:312 (+),score=28.56 TRINITY_DN70248_c0_g1_i1:92-937(+)